MRHLPPPLQAPLLAALLLPGCAAPARSAVGTVRTVGPREAGDAQVRAALEAGPAEPAGLTAAAPPLEARVRLRVAPGWHIYAEDPGEAGLPTRVTFTAPPGYRLGPVAYPPAETFEAPGPVRSFGYEREALLRAPLEAPSSPSSGPAVLRARVSWLACRESCIPGRADLAVTLPASPRHLTERP